VIVLGLISGTSVDAIDVAAAELGWEGDTVTLRALGHAERPWPEAVRARLLAALPPAPCSAEALCQLDALAGEAFAEAAAWGNAGLAGGRAALVASHGQTVFHWVEGGRARGTLQVGQPAFIAERTGLPVVSDFRARDVAAGGHGAPLASTLDALWLAGEGGTRAALNLGGIANATLVRRAGEAVLAFDTGPANCLMDAEVLAATGRARDEGGALAAAGTVREDLLGRLLAEPYYAMPPPKSTGRELFRTGYVAGHLAGLAPVPLPDLIATLAELTAITVADALRPHGVVEVVASGGGTRNPALMARLRERLAPVPLVDSAARGLPADGKEAYLFALLGFLAWYGVPGVVPGATGSRVARVLGRISPGDGPLVLPTPAGRAVGLRIAQG
jgi:anhydro-N-acetylmuramic acid kinase